MAMTSVPTLAGIASTVIFAWSVLPMLAKAHRTRDLASYSLGNLVLANVGNTVHSVYVFSLPVGPIWVMHGFYLGTSWLMLIWCLRYRLVPGPRKPPPRDGSLVRQRRPQPADTAGTALETPSRKPTGLRTVWRGEISGGLQNAVNMTLTRRGPTRRYDSRRCELAAGQTRRAIVSAARELFLEDGYVATTVEKIAERAGVSKPTVFASVGNKPPLLKAARDLAMARHVSFLINVGDKKGKILDRAVERTQPRLLLELGTY